MALGTCDRAEGAHASGTRRNLAARDARGELLAFTDADAVVEPGWLDELERALTDDVDGVAGAMSTAPRKA